MIGADLLNKIKEDQHRKKDDETDGKKEDHRKKGMGFWRFLVIGPLVFFLVFLIVSDLPPTQAKLESEYTEFFEKPCLSNVERFQDRPDYSKITRRLNDEHLRNQIKQEITDQAKRHKSKYGRKKIYEKHMKDCERLIGSGVVLDMNTRRFSPDKKREKPPSGRRTNTGLLVEKGADIDYRIAGDKIIDLSVDTIRRGGYVCNSVSSINVYKYPERIVVECNKGRDKYWIQRDSAGLFRQVTRI